MIATASILTASPILIWIHVFFLGQTSQELFIFLLHTDGKPLSGSHPPPPLALSHSGYQYI